MTIQIELDAETEARLAVKARAQGMPLEKAAALVLEQAMASGFTPPGNLAVSDFHKMLAVLAEGSEGLPSLPTESFTRERFYEDRA
jgi:hypothetical protein